MIQQVEKLLDHTLPPTISLKTELADEYLSVIGDPSSLQNAILNLAINAKDSIDDQGEITFKSRISEKPKHPLFDLKDESNTITRYAAISITDTGTGIPQDEIKRIFEPFHTTKTQGQGTGLGLSAVYGTVKTHNGLIEVKTAMGKGSEFTIFIPLAMTDTDQNQNKKKQNYEFSFNGVSVLLVDDEAMIRKTAAAMLKKLGCEVITAEDGYSGLDLYKQNPETEIAIIDMIMPKMGGDELFQHLKKVSPNLRIVVMSGYSLHEKTSQILSSPNTVFLRKPFGMLDLQNSIKKLFAMA
jgi:CheY-like chemotaxis protein